MAILQVLTIVVFANALGIVLSCGGGSPPPPPPPPPPPCSWTTCRNEYRDDWAPPITQGGCVQQARREHHVPIPHSGPAGSCPAPQPCNPIGSQHRLHCSCRYVSCSLQEWSPWGDLSTPCASNCGCERRTRSYLASVLYVTFLGRDCRGVGPQQCPPPQDETRDKTC